ncbi:hypothetical protein ABZ793_29365 [Micromonospora sp. NPDC047465]|uniref:hypothetical protein n=1 Tax=Micromonospora sp. NPDC047465 TaxID=3154813 RepID=UPI0033E95384
MAGAADDDGDPAADDGDPAADDGDPAADDGDAADDGGGHSAARHRPPAGQLVMLRRPGRRVSRW